MRTPPLPAEPGEKLFDPEPLERILSLDQGDRLRKVNPHASLSGSVERLQGDRLNLVVPVLRLQPEIDVADRQVDAVRIHPGRMIIADVGDLSPGCRDLLEAVEGPRQALPDLLQRPVEVSFEVEGAAGGPLDGKSRSDEPQSPDVDLSPQEGKDFQAGLHLVHAEDFFAVPMDFDTGKGKTEGGEELDVHLAPDTDFQPESFGCRGFEARLIPVDVGEKDEGEDGERQGRGDPTEHDPQPFFPWGLPCSSSVTLPDSDYLFPEFGSR